MNSWKALLLASVFAEGASFIAPSPVNRPPTSLRPCADLRHAKQQSRLNMSLGPLTTFLSEQLYVSPFTLPSTFTLSQVQTAGETAFAGAVAVATAQGAIISHQYATNPCGELIVPPGATHGMEDAYNAVSDQQQEKKSVEELVGDTSDTLLSRTVKKGWYHVNKFLVFLLPLLAAPFSLLLRFEHLTHMAVIMGLAHIYDFFHKVPEIAETDVSHPSFGEKPHIVVLGDSMSVGIGCVNKFDPEKNSGILRRIEQLEPEDGDGPVFPRVLAQTLSKHLHKPVTWRSAGVDGGDTQEITKYLLPVIQQEVDNGKAPDVVVVLTGSNDLKHILDNGASIRGFRSNLIKLANDIRTISPKTKVVFPALPTYTLDTNSILNVFPLTFFLDVIIGFWDAQKIQAASASDAVMHVDLKVKDVHPWYNDAETLLAADGIHPNGECYAKWARHVGNDLAEQLLLRE